MSQANIDLIRSGYDALNRSDREWAMALADPEIELETRFTQVAGRTYRGLDGVESWIADVEESWADMQQTPEKFIEVDDERTIALVSFKARGRGSGAEIEQQIAAIWTIRDGKVVRIETHASLEE